MSGEIIVKFKKAAGPAKQSDIRRAEGLEKKAELDLIDAEVDKARGQPVEQAVSNLERRSDVEYAEPNGLRYPTGYTDEPRFSQLWGLHNTGQTIEGWPGKADVDINGKEASTVTKGESNLTVAVIDDGVDFSHPDLSARAWKNPGESGNGKEANGVDDDGNGYVDDVNGWNMCHDDRTVHDTGDDSHGTHVAGTIAASINGQGIVGVAPNVKVMALKFLSDNGTGTFCNSDAGAVKAIEYATNKGIRISNNSYGGYGYSQALKDAIDASGSLFVAAAGNDSNNNDGANAMYPASYNSANILSVAAVHNEGYLTWFSNYGATSVDISAPGDDILSSVPGPGWEFWPGTSMATPHVTGVVALVASVKSGLLSKPVDLKNLIMNTGKPLSATSGYTVTGDMVDAKAAVDFAAPPDTTPPKVKRVVPKEKATGVAPGANVRAFFSEAMRKGSINKKTVKLFKKGTTTPIRAVVSYDAAKKKAILNPDAKLKRGAKYKAVVTTGAKDLAGNRLDQNPNQSGNQPKKWFFIVRK